MHRRVVALAQVCDAFGLGYRLILACHMIGNEVDHDLQPCLVATLHESLELLHAVRHIHSKVGVYVVIVGDGIGRASPSLHYERVLAGYAIGRIVGF